MLTNAVVDPFAVVVEDPNTFVAGAAVLRVLMHLQLADVTKVVGLLFRVPVAELHEIVLERNHLVL